MKHGRIRGGKGELVIDNRTSPVPLVQQCAHDEYLVVPAGESVTLKTMTCAHGCGTVVVENPRRQRERGYCLRCRSYLCDLCAFHYSLDGLCTQIEDLIEIALANPGLNVLMRGPEHSLLFDRRLLEERRIY